MDAFENWNSGSAITSIQLNTVSGSICEIGSWIEIVGIKSGSVVTNITGNGVGAQTLSALTDVSISGSQVNGQPLVWSSGSSKWLPSGVASITLMGVVTLSGGTATVNTTAVTANSRIFLTPQTLGTILRPVGIGVTARTPGASFVITSMDITDTSIIGYLIMEP
jgi:hypothetical protein